MNKNRFSKQGFTLAETLITLGIIGVVAAISIPALMNKTNNAELKAQYKKVYSDLTQATMDIISENGGTLVGAFSSSTNMKNTYKEHLSVAKDCEEGASEGICWHTFGTYKSFNGVDAVNSDQSKRPALVLNNGALVSFQRSESPIYLGDDNCTATCGSTLRCGWLLIDVNGFKKPNIVGKDIFAINILKTGLTHGGSGDSTSCDYNNCGSTATAGCWAGFGCGAWIIQGKDY